MLGFVMFSMWLLGIIQIDFECSVNRKFNKHANTTEVMMWPEHSPTGVYYNLAAQPEYLTTTPTNLIIGEGITSIIVAVAFFISTVVHSNSKGRQYGPRRTVSTLIDSIKIPWC